MLIANAQNLEPTEPSEHEASPDLADDATNLARADEAQKQRPPWAGNADRTWLDVIAAPRLAVPILLGLGFVLFIANLGGYPLYTKGEPREAVIVLDMVRGGGVILPMRAGVEIPSKPPMMHWMAAALSVMVGRVDEWTVRMPSATLAILGMIACYLYVRRLFDDRSAMLSAMMLGTTFQYLQAGTGARVDMTLTFFMEVAFFEFLMIAEGLTTRRLLLYVSLAAAVLSKGPVGLFLPAAVAAIWIVIERRFELLGRLKLIQGASVVFVLAGGWYLAAAWVAGLPFLRKQVLLENIFTFFHSGSLSGGHAHPFYYVELTLLAGFLPWSILIPGPCSLFARKSWLSQPRIRYLIVWFATVLLFYNLAHSKRGVYLLALYPALSTAVALFAAHATTRSQIRPRWLSALSAASAVIFLGAAAAGLLILIVLKLSPSVLGYWLGVCGIRAPGFMPALIARTHTALAILILAVAASVGLYLLRLRPQLEEIVIAATAGSACLTLVASLFVVPAIADTLSLKHFSRDAMRIVDGSTVAYLGALNYDVAFYSARTIPIVPAPDKDAPEYLLTWAGNYTLIPADVRGNLPIVLKSGPTELNGSGGMLLLKRAAPAAPDGNV
jgi:4-amino-4-deoxy-L-arabinose transferase-like glycosyltransferase